MTGPIDLIVELTHLVACERTATGRVLRSLIEFDARRLYLAQGYSSLFAIAPRLCTTLSMQR